ncbi:4Fe-4S dicluster domain-containing protein [Thermodesulfobacteriota bacterium]
MLSNQKDILTAYSLRDSNRPGYEDCTGCKVCTLPCPVWHQTHDIMLTHCGRARALQGGASPEDLRQSLMACVLCGACESVCPVGIDTVGMTIDLRIMLNDKSDSPFAHNLEADNKNRPTHVPVPAKQYASLILPGSRLRSNYPLLNIVKKLLENKDVSLAMDDGSYISDAIEAGIPIPDERREHFLKTLKGAKQLIVAEGILHRYLRKCLPQVQVIGLGKALLSKRMIRKALRSKDLYVIETRGYHADFNNMAQEYDIIRRKVGCLMNLDLQRAAIPTGALSLQNRSGMGTVSPVEQARWILDGHKFARIVVESLEDMEPFQKVTKLRVIHVSELSEDGGTG